MNCRKMESLTRKALYDFGMVDCVEKVTVALSGGKDSITLLKMLHAISGRGFPNFELNAVHVNGKFSCGAGVQMGFIHDLCDELEVKLVVRESTQKLDGLQCYSCSRERRKLIFDAAKEMGSETVAFGHHRDDSIETLLMNLLHKGEFMANLAKVRMVKYGVTIIRPLIYVSEAQVKGFAKNEGFLRITCQCPVGQNSQRKKVKELLSEIEEIFPNARTNLALAAHR